MLDSDRFFSLGVSLAGPSVILNSDTEFITMALMDFSSACFSFASCVSRFKKKKKKENTHRKNPL